ncbi:fungal specific transcription factor [Colletotrichum costaricense]|uniref:Fungal specific transcription factor n=1 Tax=Colletotrichum costaricense TaxID=1209916 RepID=A0AAJ0DRZ0_9PEZI|nr:fungal specific transcription factor [Colletotrichum costaricense]KAK1503899.1 fungal specific transcription factor [Colletotrichum costaricense]
MNQTPTTGSLHISFIPNDDTGAPDIGAGHECEFRDSTTLEPLTVQEGDSKVGNKRERARSLEDTTLSDEITVTEFDQNIISAPYLTVDVWHQLFDLYQLHFATELSFLHLPTLKGIIHDKDNEKPSNESNLALLGILALTARFHPDLIEHVAHITHHKIAGPRFCGALHRLQPSVASEYFANALTKALGEVESAITSATVVRVQAFLMLSLYKWSRPDGGLAAWMYVDLATRMAQIMKLGSAQVPSRCWQDQESRRRTMFSCFILCQLQLPCSDEAFNLGGSILIRTPRPVGQGIEEVFEDSVLGRFVDLIKVWGDISKYSILGGRDTGKEEGTPPWDEKSTFYQLSQEIDTFYTGLPECFTWSTSNFWRHSNSIYVSFNMLAALCRIVLHREYIPFIAINCARPMGPMAELGFDPGAAPDGHWKRSAEQIFKASREIVDLITLCRDRLPYSSLVLFAIRQAAFVEIYAAHYPHMDTQNHMFSEQEVGRRNSRPMSDNWQPTTTTYQALTKATPYFSLASNYVIYLKSIDQCLTRINSDYRDGGSRQSRDDPLGIRRDGRGGDWDGRGDPRPIHQQAGSHDSSTHGFSPTVGSPQNEVEMASKNANELKPDVYVRYQQGRRLSIMFDDIFEFATGGKGCTPNLGSRNTFNPPFCWGSDPYPGLSSNESQPYGRLGTDDKHGDYTGVPRELPSIAEAKHPSGLVDPSDQFYDVIESSPSRST